MQTSTARQGARGTVQGSWVQYRSKLYVASTHARYGTGQVAGATLGRMRSTPDLDRALEQRLREAVVRFAGGSADAFGQKIGYANGGYIREVLTKKKPVRESLIERVHAVPEMRDWFAAVLTPIAAADVSASSCQRAAPADELEARLLAAMRFLLPEDRASLVAMAEEQAEKARRYAEHLKHLEAADGSRSKRDDRSAA